MNTFTDLSIIGVAVSLITELLNKYFANDSFKARITVVVLSIFAGSSYFFLKDTILWQNILGVLAAASAVYAFVFNKK